MSTSTVAVVAVLALGINALLMAALWKTIRQLTCDWASRISRESAIKEELMHTLDDLLRIAPEGAESLELTDVDVAWCGPAPPRRAASAAGRCDWEHPGTVGASVRTDQGEYAPFDAGGDDRRNDRVRAFRGVLVGMLISAPLWAIVLVAWLVIR